MEIHRRSVRKEVACISGREKAKLKFERIDDDRIVEYREPSVVPHRFLKAVCTGFLLIVATSI
jgi:hypothetical protein